MSDSAAASPETSRRRLLAWLGAGGVAALATLFSRDEAKAGHDGTNVLHLGEYNIAPPGSSLGGHTILDGEIDGRTLKVVNSDAGPNSGAIEAVSNGDGPAVQGNALATVAVSGISHLSHDPDGFGKGSGTGVFGESGSGAGVAGWSETGVGGSFGSASGVGLQVGGSAHVGASVDNFALGVDNEAASETAGGILAVSRGGKPAVEGDAIPSEEHAGIGVQGVSGFDETFGEGPGIGVQGISGTGVGVDALSAEGLALRVQGRAAFSTIGSAVVPNGADSVFVANEAVTEASHVTVTLTGDPGRRQVSWVERDPGNGFTVHLTAGPRQSVPLTYAIMEPA